MSANEVLQSHQEFPSLTIEQDHKIKKELQRYGVKSQQDRVAIRSWFKEQTQYSALHEIEDWQKNGPPKTAKMAAFFADCVQNIYKLIQESSTPDLSTLDVFSKTFTFASKNFTLFSLLPSLEAYYDDYQFLPNKARQEKLDILEKIALQLKSPKLLVCLYISGLCESHSSLKNEQPELYTAFLEIIADLDQSMLSDIAEYSEAVHLLKQAKTQTEQLRKDTGLTISIRQSLAEACLFLIRKGHSSVLMRELFIELNTKKDTSKKLKAITDSVLFDFISQSGITELLSDKHSPAEKRFSRLYKVLTYCVLLSLIAVPAYEVVSRVPDALSSLGDGFNSLLSMYDNSRLEDAINIDYEPPVEPTPTAAPEVLESGLEVKVGQTSPAQTAELLELNQQQLITDVEQLNQQPQEQTTALGNGIFASSDHMSATEGFYDPDPLQTAEALINGRYVTVGEFRGQWLNGIPDHLENISFVVLTEDGGIIQQPKPEITSPVTPLSLLDQQPTQDHFVYYMSALTGNEWISSLRPTNQMPSAARFNVYINNSYVGYYEGELALAPNTSDFFIRAVRSDEEIAWLDQQAASGSEVRIELLTTFAPEPIRTLERTPQFERPLLGAQDMPSALAQIAQEPIANTGTAQLQKSQEIYDWYMANITAETYTLNPLDHQTLYVQNINWPTARDEELAFVRTFFRLNDAELGLEGSIHPIMGAHECGRANQVLYHVLQYFLSLQPEIKLQIQLNNGFLIGDSRVTNSESHNYLTIIDLETGQEYIFDATGTKAPNDTYTDLVFPAQNAQETTLVDQSNAQNDNQLNTAGDPAVALELSPDMQNMYYAFFETTNATGFYTTETDRRYPVQGFTVTAGDIYDGYIIPFHNFGFAGSGHNTVVTAEEVSQTREELLRRGPSEMVTENTFFNTYFHEWQVDPHSLQAVDFVLRGDTVFPETSVYFNSVELPVATKFNDQGEFTLGIEPEDLTFLASYNHLSFDRTDPNSKLRLQRYTIQLPAGSNIVPLDLGQFEISQQGLSFRVNGLLVPYTTYAFC